MKKKTFMLMLASLFILKGVAQQVVPVQGSLITKRTASWCPHCGSWGWSLFHDLLDENKGKAVFFAAHFDGVLESQEALDITNNFGAAYQPVFYLNETNQEATSSNGSTIRSLVKQQVDDAFDNMPVANVGFDSTYVGGAMKVDAKVKFFQATTGEFYLGIYLIEDNVVATQASIGANANHVKVLRESFTNSTWGNLIGNGNFAAGDEFTQSFSLPVDNPANHDYQLAGIIWKKEGDKYKVVNTWSTDIEGGASQSGEPVSKDRFFLVPTVSSTTVKVCVSLDQDLKNGKLDLFDSAGSLLDNIYEGSLPKGEHTFEISRDKTGSGVHFVRFSHADQVQVEKFVFQ